MPHIYVNVFQLFIVLYTILQCTKFRQTKMCLDLGYCMQPNVFLHIHICLIFLHLTPKKCLQKYNFTITVLVV